MQERDRAAKKGKEEFLRDNKNFGSPARIQKLSRIMAEAFSRTKSRTCTSVNQRKFTEHRKMCLSMSKAILPGKLQRGTDNAHFTDH